MDDLKVKEPGAKYCHFPKRDDYGPAFFTGLLSERLVYKPEHKKPWQWEKIPGHERNEALDCRNYALAAFKALPKDLDATDKRLKAAKNEVQHIPAAVQSPQAEPARKSVKKKPKGSALKKYYDDW